MWHDNSFWILWWWGMWNSEDLSIPLRIPCHHIRAYNISGFWIITFVALITFFSLLQIDKLINWLMNDLLKVYKDRYIIFVGYESRLKILNYNLTKTLPIFSKISYFQHKLPIFIILLLLKKLYKVKTISSFFKVNQLEVRTKKII